MKGREGQYIAPKLMPGCDPQKIFLQQFQAKQQKGSSGKNKQINQFKTFHTKNEVKEDKMK